MHGCKQGSHFPEKNSHIKNISPEKGKTVLTLKKAFEINSSLINKKAMFGSFDRAKNGNIYILDWRKTRIYVFDSSGKFIKEFLKKGKGPGEFSFVQDIQIVDSRIWVIGFRKIASFDLNGRFINEFKFKKWLYKPIFILNEKHFIASYEEYSGETDISKNLALLSFDGSILKRIFKARNAGRLFVRYGKHRISVIPSPFSLPDIRAAFDSHDKVLYVARSDSYVIYKKNLSGRTLLTIKRKYIRKRFIMEDKIKEVEELGPIPDNIKKAVIKALPDRLCAIYDVKLTSRGYIVVSRIKGYGKIKFDVFHNSGKYLYILELPENFPVNNFKFYPGRVATILETRNGYSYIEYEVKNPSGIF